MDVLSALCADTRAAVFKAQHLTHRPKAQTYEERSPAVMGSSEPLSNKQQHAISRYRTSPHTFIFESKHHLTHCTPVHPVPGPFLTNDTFNEPIHYSEVKVAEQHWNNYLDPHLFPEDVCKPENHRFVSGGKHL